VEDVENPTIDDGPDRFGYQVIMNTEA